MCCGRGQCDGCDEGEMGVVTGRGLNAATPLGAIKSGGSRQQMMTSRGVAAPMRFQEMASCITSIASSAAAMMSGDGGGSSR
jgi:NADH:ubiquinone oxidoreductase subunit F (NADH-binding)